MRGDARLAHIDPAETRRAAADGAALSLKELAVAKGMSYDTVRKLARLSDFPVMEGKVFGADFDLWRQMRLGLVPVVGASPHIAARRPRSNAGKCD